MNSAKLLTVAAVDDPVPLPAYAGQYAETAVLKVEYDLNLVAPEQRRDPTLREGRQWSYFLLVSEGPGKPWLIASMITSGQPSNQSLGTTRNRAPL